MSVKADVETFRRIPIFAECDPVHLQVLAFSAGRQSFAAGETLMREDDPADAAFLILSGETTLRARREGAIGTAGAGALLGEVAMIGARPYALTVAASEPVTALRIDQRAVPPGCTGVSRIRRHGVQKPREEARAFRGRDRRHPPGL